MKKGLMWFFAFVFLFYTTFVFQNLWNWFVVPAINASPISYWHMFGLNLVIGMFKERSTFKGDKRWKRAELLLQACVPPEHRRAVEEALNSEEKEENLLTEAFGVAFMKVGGDTLALVGGWVVHALLV